MSTAKEKFELARQRYAATFERHLDNGVEFISDNVYIEPEVIITPGTVILPGCILRGKTVIAENCVIGPNTLLEDTVVEAAKANEKVAKAIAGMQIVKVIHVKNKLVNLIVKPC